MLPRLALAPQGVLSATSSALASSRPTFVQRQANGDDLGEDACGLCGRVMHACADIAFDGVQVEYGPPRP
jgi:hypothetical protein